MKKKHISRRKFLSDFATAAGATLLVACVPVNRTQQPGKDTSVQPLTPENPAPTSLTGSTLKVLVVYDTIYGNTAKIAEAIIEGIGGNQESRLIKAQEASADILQDVDLLLVGSPTHAGTFIEPVKNFLAGIPADALQNVRVAAFDTSFNIQTQGAFLRFIMRTFGYAAPKIADKLSEKGATVLAAETFIVLESEGPLQEGEVERARDWASALIDKVLET